MFIFIFVLFYICESIEEVKVLFQFNNLYILIILMNFKFTFSHEKLLIGLSVKKIILYLSVIKLEE